MEQKPVEVEGKESGNILLFFIHLLNLAWSPSKFDAVALLEPLGTQIVLYREIIDS